MHFRSRLDDDRVPQPCSFTADAHFGTHSRTYDRPNSIQHWQLRDLVSCTEDDAGRQQLFTVCGRRTYRFDVQAEQSAVVQELMFSPSSMTLGDGFIAAGGTSSQLDVHSLDGLFSFKGSVNGSVNNAMHIAKDQTGKAQLFCCNNDRTIKTFSLPAMERGPQIPTETPINYTALSPDARTLVAVGDQPYLYFFRAAPAGWVPADKWRAGRDAGMCCAWSPHSGELLAAVFQDGLAGLWDARSGDVVASMRTSMAARCVKFSPGSVHLLAIAEHQGATHMVDLRNLSAVQTISPDPLGHQHNISGLAFSPGGQQLYIGLEEGGIARLDIDTYARRTFAAGQLA